MVRESVKDENAEILVVAAKTEADIAELETYEDRQMFLEEVGLEESGVSRLIKSAYSLLNLQTYFTAGVQEVRAWTYEKGWKAPQCAGVIHTDFEKGFIRAEVITTGVKDICGDCDLVVEAAIENMEIKKQTFKELDAICKPSCIFATNTSSLSITEIGGAVERHVIGMHFFNPAPVMKLVEVIAGLNTKPEDVEAVKKISEEIGKTPVQVEEAAGFVVNRILIPMVNEAVGIYADGVASVEGIDTAVGRSKIKLLNALLNKQFIRRFFWKDSNKVFGCKK